LSEFGSEAAFKRLQAEASQIRCRAIREQGIVELPVEEVVVGDLKFKDSVAPTKEDEAESYPTD
jgi:magnesium-transporting ATPase (P-type)